MAAYKVIFIFDGRMMKETISSTTPGTPSPPFGAGRTFVETSHRLRHTTHTYPSASP
jgi:hypothetical protein